MIGPPVPISETWAAPARRECVPSRGSQGLRPVGQVAFGVTPPQTDGEVGHRPGVPTIAVPPSAARRSRAQDVPQPIDHDDRPRW